MTNNKMTTVARMNQREFLAIWARLAAHEDALRSLHAALDRGVGTLADGLALALGKLTRMARKASRVRRAGRRRRAHRR